MSIISVIIPVFNGAKTIRETIVSVLNQTFADLELLIIDDGSNDSTLEIISRIDDSRVNVFTYPNGGLAVSRNRGICHACGEYISFLDADDLWTPDKLELQLKALKENPSAAVAYSWTDCIDENSNFLYPGMHLSFSGDVYAELLLKNFIQNGSNPLIRRSALIKVGNFNPSLNPSEDRDMWLRLALNYNFVAVSYPQILYRITSSSMSSNISKMEKAGLKVLELAFKQAPTSLQSLKNISVANHYKGLVWKLTDGLPGYKRRSAAIKYFFKYITNDPNKFKDINLKSKLFMKIIK